MDSNVTPPADTSVQTPAQAKPQPSPNTPLPKVKLPKAPEQKLKRLRIYFIISLVLLLTLIVLILVMLPKVKATAKVLTSRYQVGMTDGRIAQKEDDRGKIKDANENPYRTYQADPSNGSFSLTFPRNWSLSTSSSGADQLIGFADPDFVDQKKNKYALRFILRDAKYPTQKDKYQNLVKNSKGKLKGEDTEASGIKGSKYTGFLEDVKSNGIVVLIPVRDKTLLIQTDNSELFTQNYQEVLNKAKILP